MDNNTPLQPQPPTPPEQPAMPSAYGAGGFGPATPTQSAAPTQFASAPAYAQPPQASAFGAPSQPVAQTVVDPVTLTPTAPTLGASLQTAPAAGPASVNRKPSRAPWWLWVIVAVLGLAVIGLAAAVFLIK